MQIFAGARAAARVVPPKLCTNALASFLLAAVSELIEAVRARLAAVSCWRTVVSFNAATARFSRTLPMRSMVGAAVGITVWAPPRGLPPTEAWSWCWCLRWARPKKTPSGLATYKTRPVGLPNCQPHKGSAGLHGQLSRPS